MIEGQEQPDGTSPSGNSLLHWLRHVQTAFGLDRAIAFAVLARIWQLLTGPLTQLMLVAFMSTQARDFYYAFAGLLGAQIFVELGLNIIVLNVSSHEWASLSLADGRPVGDTSALARLASLRYQMQRWYNGAAGLFLATVATGGYIWFLATRGDEHSSGVAWAAPWIVYVIINTVQLTRIPLLAMLEGCNQISYLNRIRFTQAVIGTSVVWIALWSGLHLWSLVASAAVRLAFDLYVIHHRYRLFFETLIPSESTSGIQWREEILPLQWRMAVQGIFHWYANGLPLLLTFGSGAEGDAGRLGMTWTILTAAQAAALSWVETRRPQFGMLIASRQYEELDRIFFRQSRLSILMMSIASAGLCLIVLIAGNREEKVFQLLSDGLMPLSAIVLMSVGFVVNQPGLCANLYVRAHKRDPFLIASPVANSAVAMLQIAFGWYLGLTGVSLGYLLGISLVQTPLLLMIWARTRRDWHAPVENDS